MQERDGLEKQVLECNPDHAAVEQEVAEHYFNCTSQNMMNEHFSVFSGLPNQTAIFLSIVDNSLQNLKTGAKM